MSVRCLVQEVANALQVPGTVQEVANTGQVPGTRSSKYRSSAWYKKWQMPFKCLVQEVASAGSSLALFVNPGIDIACRVRLNSTTAHSACAGALFWTCNFIVAYTSATDGSEWRASFPGRFTVERKTPGIQWTGFWMGPGTDLGAKRETSFPARNWTPTIRSSRDKYCSDRVSWPLDIHKQN